MNMLKHPFEEAKTPTARKALVSAILAEFFCTAAFVFVATAAVTSGCHTADTARQSGATSQELENGKQGEACRGTESRDR